MTRTALVMGLAACALSAGCVAVVDTKVVHDGYVRYLNPDALHHNPAFSQAVVVHGSNTTVYIGGQDAVDASGNIVGKGDIAAQAEQIAHNMEAALAAAGAKPDDVVKWTIYVVNGQNPGPAHAVFQKRWGERANPPIITMVYVSALAHPDFLMEMDAVAVIPECNDGDLEND